MRQLNTVLAVTMLIAVATTTLGQGNDYRSCNNYLPKPRSVLGQDVGPESCLMQQTDMSYLDRDYVRVDMGIDGTAEGYVTMDGTYHEYLTNSPDLIFEQAATPGNRHLAIARYERLRGSAILLAYPKKRADWNGKLWVIAHGRGRSFRNGQLVIWDRYLDRNNPLDRFDKIDRVMLSKGYAVARTFRTSEQDIGEVIATLDDGRIIDFAAFNDNAAIIKDFTLITEDALERRLGSKPSRTFLYGHSAGARIARSINYTPGLNADHRGRPIFDGYLMDDSASGLWLPVVVKNGRDVLFSTDEERATFQPQVEIVHQMYTKIWNRAPDRPPWITRGYLTNKRLNGKILVDKGFGDRFRMYEVRSMSHNGGEGLPPDNRRGKALVLDVSLIMGGAIDKLEQLVDGEAPLASKSDWAVIGDVDGDTVIDNPAIAYPEVACPLGVFYPYPQSGSGTTAFAAFTGRGLEPLDEADMFVDMNRNGIWDFRETPSESWRRLGILEAGEDLTHERYVDCVTEAAKLLWEEGFFTDAIAERYVDMAQAQTLDPSKLTE